MVQFRMRINYIVAMALLYVLFTKNLQVGFIVALSQSIFYRVFINKLQKIRLIIYRSFPDNRFSFSDKPKGRENFLILYKVKLIEF